MVELLEEEDVKLSPEQLAGIISIIQKEKRIHEEDKQQKKQQQSLGDNKPKNVQSSL